MRVRLTTLMAGPEGVVQAGSELELARPQALGLIQAGAAVAVDGPRVAPSPPAAESAAMAAPETPEQRGRRAPRPRAKRKA